MNAPYSVTGLSGAPRLLILALGLVALSGCSVFSRKPALPRHAAIEHGDGPRAATDYPSLVANADIAYFPAERAAFGAKSEPSALLLEALRRDGALFAIAWDLLDASQQPLLDELAGKSDGAREEVIARLEFGGTGRARAHFRAVLRDERLLEMRHLALGCPPALLAKVETRERFTPEEEKILPRGYSLPPRSLEAYAEQAAASRGEGMRSYRATVASQQFAADRIVRHFREVASGSKLLVFLRAEDLRVELGVPRYVAQKLKVRQLVLDSSGAAPVRAQLLTQRD